jgi:hypothetical protein
MAIEPIIRQFEFDKVQRRYCGPRDSLNPIDIWKRGKANLVRH